MTESILTLPPQTITVGLPFQLTLRLEDTTESDPVVPLTGYTVAWSLSEAPFDASFADGVGEILAAVAGDRAYFSITAATTADFGAYARDVVRGRPSAMLQIALTAPVAANSMILQGPAIIQGTF